MKKRNKKYQPIIKIEKNKRNNNKNNANIIVTITIAIIAVIAAYVIINSYNTKEYHGYWCKYKEIATIVILLNDEHTQEERKEIENKIHAFDNISAMNTFSKEEYAEQIGANANEMDIHDAIVVTFSSLDSIGTYVEDLNKLTGVLKAEQSYAKNDINLYNIKKNKSYTFTNSDEALKEDIIKGKYKEKNGVLTFKPKDKNKKETLLYFKDGLLCEDPSCDEIYFKSTNTCKPKTK